MRRLVVGFFAAVGFLTVLLAVGVFLLTRELKPVVTPLADNIILTIDLTQGLSEGSRQDRLLRLLVGSEPTLRDVLDGIEDTSYRMVAYRLDPIPPTVVELCEVVHDSAKSIASAFDKLNKDEKLLDDCIEVNRLEDYADMVARRAIAALFEQEKDPIALIKHKEIFEALEGITDRCEDVADVLQNVVVKNS